ncbi:hypothetical protein VTN77DRAFT_87 [Rasamsonia byssochlamydoides]|uniref:uncharacterized protein n=1 Tax=Rasamsonia byssochlamydoides TaxID=89139 RepID=UPI00374471FB
MDPTFVRSTFLGSRRNPMAWKQDNGRMRTTPERRLYRLTSPGVDGILSTEPFRYYGITPEPFEHSLLALAAYVASGCPSLSHSRDLPEFFYTSADHGHSNASERSGQTGPEQIVGRLKFRACRVLVGVAQLGQAGCPWGKRTGAGSWGSEIGR